MKLPKIALAQTLIQLCKSKGVKHIIISPGSRNAPLTIGFSNHDYFECYSIVDERCAAFFALGMAQQLQEPVAVLCTSGSALLNYYPAVAEAYYSDVPLVVLSADRPKHLLGIGDGQTIDQEHVFANHILYSANLKEDKQRLNEAEINEALNMAISQNGPVHINIPFDEPLYDRVDEFTVFPESIPIKDSLTEVESLEAYCSIWKSAKRKLVLVGVNMPNTVDQKYLDILANDGSVVVFTETTSNLYHNKFFPSIDQIIVPLNNDGYKQLQPEIVLTFGGLIVSKKIKAFLRDLKPKHHWHIDEKKANNTFFCLDKHFKYDVNGFFELFFKNYQSQESDYNNYWQNIKQSRLEKHDTYLSSIPYTDLKAFDVILKSIPNDNMLQLGNSSTVRYAQLFSLNKTLKVYCNRGTSGIDGSTSTAIGAAIASNKQTVLITGDLSFFYDSNALWNNYVPNNFRIIVINNCGGGIFRILPGHKNSDNFDTYFETRHQLSAKQLCEMYGFEYSSANDISEINNEKSTFYLNSHKPKLLEVFTPRTTNDEVLLDYFKSLS
jgi:2-succinyl-5-enolpyruvyl-6-hydroxy-3-cyclohexene-1-carboxylate synthase